MFHSIAIAAAALLATAAPATARPADSEAAARKTAAAVALERVAANPTTKFCVNETITGSLLSRKTCHTRSEWISRGVDPVDLIGRRR